MHGIVKIKVVNSSVSAPRYTLLPGPGTCHLDYLGSITKSKTAKCMLKLPTLEFLQIAHTEEEIRKTKQNPQSLCP